MATTVRLQVDILEHQLEELEELQKLGGLRSKRELWDTAFTLLKWATKKRAHHSSVGSLNDQGLYTELEMPFLEHYARSVQSEQSRNMAADKTDSSPQRLARASGSTPKRLGSSNGTLSLAKKRQTA